MNLSQLRRELANASPARFLQLLSDHVWEQPGIRAGLSSESKEGGAVIANGFLENVSADVQSRVSAIPVGAIPIDTFNVSTVRVPAGGDVVIFDTGFMYWLFAMTQIWAGTAEWHDEHFPEIVPKRYSGREAARLAMLLTRSWVSPDSSSLSRIRVDTSDITGKVNRKSATVGTLLLGAEFFVLAHEYAHVLLKHNDQSDVHTRHVLVCDKERLDLNVLKRSRAQEFNADKLGFEMLINRSRDRKSGFDFLVDCGAFFFFIYCDFLERLARGEHPPFQLEVDEAILTHPKASSRFDALYSLYQEQLSDEQRQIIMAVRTDFEESLSLFGDMYTTMMETLQRNPEEFLNNVREGMRLFFGEELH